MIIRADHLPPAGLSNWLAARLGTRRWCIANRLRKGDPRYDLAISHARYAALKNEYIGLCMAKAMFAGRVASQALES